MRKAVSRAWVGAGAEGAADTACKPLREFRRVRDQTGHTPPVGRASCAWACIAATTLGVAALVCAGTAAAQTATPTAAPAAADSPPANPTARIVAGIVSYTRWPDEVPAMRLCALGRGIGVEALVQAGEFGTPNRRVRVVEAATLGAAERDCHVIYLGRIGTPEVRQAVRQFAGRPVLLLGEGADFCTEGGMFCIEPASDTPARFGVNLDAVARSGLRVNPQVLRIARSEGHGS